jgi:hypothetical protein
MLPAVLCACAAHTARAAAAIMQLRRMDRKNLDLENRYIGDGSLSVFLRTQTPDSGMAIGNLNQTYAALQKSWRISSDLKGDFDEYSALNHAQPLAAASEARPAEAG